MATRHPKRGPRGADAHTRDDILRAALTLFIDTGYEATSMRAVARAAGVDASLPRHYFPSKSQLFVEALGPFEHVEGNMAILAAGPPDRVGERIVRMFLGLWDSPTLGPRLKILLVTGTNTPEIAEVFKAVVVQKVFVRIVEAVGGDDAPGRAAALASQMLGLALARYVLQLEPMASATPDWIVERFAPSVQLLVTGHHATT